MPAFINLEDRQIRIVNEDGTDIDFEYPETDLYDKWDMLYPPTKYGKPCGPVLGHQKDGAPIMNYGCVLCHNSKCRHSKYWEVPEEDKEKWEKYQQEVKEYNRKHNPTSYKTVEEFDKNKED